MKRKTLIITILSLILIIVGLVLIFACFKKEEIMINKTTTTEEIEDIETSNVSVPNTIKRLGSGWPTTVTIKEKRTTPTIINNSNKNGKYSDLVNHLNINEWGKAYINVKGGVSNLPVRITKMIRGTDALDIISNYPDKYIYIGEWELLIVYYEVDMKDVEYSGYDKLTMSVRKNNEDTVIEYKGDYSLGTTSLECNYDSSNNKLTGINVLKLIPGSNDYMIVVGDEFDIGAAFFNGI